jgi:NADPH:quinone reductase-like Zn-dependent oxidoreductase
VVAVVRNPDRAGFATSAGANEVVVTADLSEAAAKGPYDAIVDTVGGASTEQALGQLAVNGLYIVCAAPAPAAIPDPGFLLTRNARVQVFGGQVEEKWSPPAAGLKRLLACLADGRLKAPVEERGSWKDVAAACARLAERKVSGKIVLTVD